MEAIFYPKQTTLWERKRSVWVTWWSLWLQENPRRLRLSCWRGLYTSRRPLSWLFIGQTPESHRDLPIVSNLGWSCVLSELSSTYFFLSVTLLMDSSSILTSVSRPLTGTCGGGGGPHGETCHLRGPARSFWHMVGILFCTEFPTWLSTFLKYSDILWQWVVGRFSFDYKYQFIVCKLWRRVVAE